MSEKNFLCRHRWHLIARYQQKTDIKLNIHIPFQTISHQGLNHVLVLTSTKSEHPKARNAKNKTSNNFRNFFLRTNAPTRHKTPKRIQNPASNKLKYSQISMNLTAFGGTFY